MIYNIKGFKKGCYLSGLFLFLINLSCNQEFEERIVVDFKKNTVEAPEKTVDKNNQIYIAIASMTSPRETINYYDELIHYFSDKLGQTILIKQKKTYKEVNNLIKNGEVEFAFICSGAYSELSKSGEAQLLVAPVINGKTKYQAYLIANKHIGVEKFEDLKYLDFAFTDPLSLTGYVYPQQLLRERETNQRLFFANTIFTYGHDISIEMVNRNVMDGASVHGLIFDYLSEVHPDRVQNVKVINKSEWFGIPPVVIPNNLDSEKTEKYRNLFLNTHKDSLGQTILEKLKIDSFVVVKDSIYDSLRKLRTDVRN